mgnify:CR=1 FL=1
MIATNFCDTSVPSCGSATTNQLRTEECQLKYKHGQGVSRQEEGATDPLDDAAAEEARTLALLLAHDLAARGAVGDQRVSQRLAVAGRAAARLGLLALRRPQQSLAIAEEEAASQNRRGPSLLP